jgi:hypothetical protein
MPTENSPFFCAEISPIRLEQVADGSRMKVDRQLDRQQGCRQASLVQLLSCRYSTPNSAGRIRD